MTTCFFFLTFILLFVNVLNFSYSYVEYISVERFKIMEHYSSRLFFVAIYGFILKVMHMWRLVIASESHGQERMEDEGHIPSGRSTPVADNMAGQNNVDASPIVISTTKVRPMNVL